MVQLYTAEYLKLYESEEKVTTERKTQHSNQAIKNLMMYYYEVQQSSANSFDGRLVLLRPVVQGLKIRPNIMYALISGENQEGLE